MEFLHGHLLSALIFLPVLGNFVLLLLPKTQESILKGVAFGFSILTFFTSLLLFIWFDGDTSGLQLVEKFSWISQFGTNYFVGVDGISLLLIMLTTFLVPLAFLGSWKSITKHVKGFLCCLLLLEAGIIGVFASIDLFLFYVFWEAMLIPMYFIIGIWGGSRRIYATFKFVLYTMVGSLLMLVAIITLVILHQQQFGAYSTSLIDLFKVTVPTGPAFFNLQMLLFIAFALAFLIKVPLFPFHTWLPDAHVEAPTAGSVILAGVLLKMGAYGMIRFAMPLFPEALDQMTPLLLILSAIGIVYGALVAMAQIDIKKLVAYSSVSHLGFVMVGLLALNELGTTGGIYQMLSHGLSTGALFLLVGVLYERKHTRVISELGGLSKELPWFAVLFFMILQGLFERYRLFAVISTSGVVLGAIYMLNAYQKMMFGEYRPGPGPSKDLSLREKLLFIPILIMILWMGVFPGFFISKVEKSIDHFVFNFRNYTISEGVSP